MSAVLQSGVHELEDKKETQAQIEDSQDHFPKKLPSLVHFFPTPTDSDSTTLPYSRSLSDEIPLSYCLSSPQVSGTTISTIGPKPLKPALVTRSRSENSSGLNIGKIPKKHTIPVLAGEPAVIGEGEDYFLSLFGDTRKLVHSFHEKTWKHFSMILEEVGQSRSSSRALELSSCGTSSSLPYGVWTVPRPGIKGSPTLADGSLITGSPEKSQISFAIDLYFSFILVKEHNLYDLSHTVLKVLRLTF